MKKTGRRLPWITLCARLTLAAFATTMPGTSAWAQVVERLAPVSAPAVFAGALGAPLAAPSLGGAAPAAGLKALSAAALSAPALSAAPLSAAAAPAAAASAQAAEPAPVQAVAAEAAPVDAVVTAPTGRATALDNLRLSGETSNDGSGRIGSGRFDGAARRGSTDDDGGGSKSRALVASAGLPAQAPVVALTRVFFPGVNTVRLGLSADYATAISQAMSNGGYMIAATLGTGTAQGHNATATLVRLSNFEVIGGKPTALMTPLRAVNIDGYGKSDGVVVAKVSYAKSAPSDPERMSALGSLAQHTLDEFAGLDPEIDSDLVEHALAETNVDRLTNLLAQDFPFSAEVKVQLLAENSMEKRLQSVILEMNAYFKEKTGKAKAVAGGDASEMKIDTVEGLKAKMTAIGMPADIQAITLKEFEKLSQMNPKDSEAQKLRSYVEWLTDVPWGQRTTDNLDIAQARAILDHDHSGLEKVKERVLEFLALRKKTGSKKGAIIAFTGPPGVGKTSIAAAIAQALGRKFVRLSLGGVHDETVLRGHGRTYLGSMPGEIMRQMKNAGTINPVMLMDEADKIGRNGNAGDPTAALLEILDPAQNNTYRDRYLDVPYDLSEVLFVVTSNELSNIPEPLRDRMEIIEFSGYTTLEKMDIAERHVIPQKLAATGLTAAEATLTPAAIRRIIEGYTMEAGVRSLREKIEAVLRKVSAWTETRSEKAPGVIDEGDVAKYLGVPPFSARQTAQNGVGVATGLAVNAYGGSTLNVEVSYEPGSGQLKLRKQFGDDIEDSARNAYKYVKTHAAKYGLEKLDFTKIDLDIDITPAGKVDGPSAGGLMVTAIISALTGRAVTPGLAMTGEITMRGDILPIGGLKQKVMAAHRMGYKEVIFPAANLKDIEDIPKEVRDGIILKPAATYDDIYPDAVVPQVSGTPASTVAPSSTPMPAAATARPGFFARMLAALRARGLWPAA